MAGEIKHATVFTSGDPVMDEDDWNADHTIDASAMRTALNVADGADVTADNETSHADVLVDGDIGVNIAAYSHNHSGVYEPADATILKDVDIGVNVAAQSHAIATTNPHSVTLAQVGGTTDHTALSNIGTNTHAQIDTHLAASAPHPSHTVNLPTATFYVDLSLGTDDTSHGTASGTSAWLTIQYAYDSIAKNYINGNILVYVVGTTCAEDLAFGGGAASGAFTITFKGYTTDLVSTTMTGGTAGDISTQATVIKSGAGWDRVDPVADSGTTTSTSANKLVQTGKSFLFTVCMGMCVHNTTDNTYAYITAVDSHTQLSLSANIMTSGESYEIGWGTYEGRWIEFTSGTNNGIVKCITDNTDDTLTLAGEFLSNAPTNGDSFKIFKNNTTCTGNLTVLPSSVKVVFENINTQSYTWDLIQCNLLFKYCQILIRYNTTATNIGNNFNTVYITFDSCNFANLIDIGGYGSLGGYWIKNTYYSMSECFGRGNGNNTWLMLSEGGIGLVTLGTVFKGYGGLGACWARYNGFVQHWGGNSTTSNPTYIKIKYNVKGLYASMGGKMEPISDIVFSNNTSNYSAEAAQFSIIA